MSSELRLGLAGARFGEKHAAAFSEVDGVILAAISDPDESRRQALVDEYEIKRTFDTYDEMLEAGELDAVVICLPTALHERSVSGLRCGTPCPLRKASCCVKRNVQDRQCSRVCGKPTCGLGNNAFTRNRQGSRSSNAGRLARPIS